MYNSIATTNSIPVDRDRFQSEGILVQPDDSARSPGIYGPGQTYLRGRSSTFAINGTANGTNTASEDATSVTLNGNTRQYGHDVSLVSTG